METYGQTVQYPILSAYTTTAGNTAGPRVVRLWRTAGTDNYVRLANADHECWPVSTDTALDNGLSEPQRFILVDVNTQWEQFPKSWYFSEGGHYKTSYAVSWWNHNYGNSSRKAFLRFRPIVVPEFASSDYYPTDIPNTSAATRGFGLVQYFGQKVVNGIRQPLYGVGIVVMASIPDNPGDPQTGVSFKKYLVFFVGDRCVWHYEFAQPSDIAHAEKVNNVWVPTVSANWISMRPGAGGDNISNGPINIGVFTYSADDDVSENVRIFPGALENSGSVDMPGTRIDLYTEHHVIRVSVDLAGENRTPSGGATDPDTRVGTGNQQWYVPSITDPEEDPNEPIGDWEGWRYWAFHTWLLGVQSALREFTFSIPLNFTNPPSNPYKVRARSLHQLDLPLNATSYFVRFRGTNNAAHFPNSPGSATSYTPVAAPYPYNCCGWYRPWNGSAEPLHRYWWVDHKIIHGVP